MTQSPGRYAKRHGLPTDGLGGELAHDAIEDARDGMRGWRGVIPAHVGGADLVQVLGGGSQVLLTFDTPEGPVQLVVPTEQASGLARRLHDLAGSTHLIVPTQGATIR